MSASRAEKAYFCNIRRNDKASHLEWSQYTSTAKSNPSTR